MDIFESLENLNVSEECFDDIMGIVEEILLERNQENKQKKKEWELKRGAVEPGSYVKDNRDRTIPMRELTIKQLKKHADKEHPAVQGAVDEIAKANRVALGREQNPITTKPSSEFLKHHSEKDRVAQSQRGTTKDKSASILGDKLNSYKWKREHRNDK